MQALELLGQVAVALMRRILDEGRDDGGFARFLLHPLATDEIVAVAGAVATDPKLSARLEVRLPRYRFGQEAGLDASFLTDLNATSLRHEECSREGRVWALLDDSQAQSLAQVDRLGAEALLAEATSVVWIEEAGGGLGLPIEQMEHWVASLTALVRLGRAPLRRVAAYVAATAMSVVETGSLTRALGHALPELGLPRHDSLFEEIPLAKRGWPSQWRTKLQSHWRRDCYASRRDLQQVPFSRSRLHEMLEAQTGIASPQLLETLARYTGASDKDDNALMGPFLYDWPEVQPFFEGTPRQRAVTLGQETKEFYAIRAPELLSDEDSTYIDELVERGHNLRRDLQDEDFHRAHGAELREDPHLKALWDRLIFGTEIVRHDFLDGLVVGLKRLYSAQDDVAAILVVEGLEQQPVNFLSLNDEICQLFATRYRGLHNALSGLVEFRLVEAFRYSDFADDIANRRGRTPEASGRRARQLRFNIWMEHQRPGGTVSKSASLRLVWEGDLNSVGIGLESDLRRLLTNRAKTPLVRCTAGRRRAGTRARSSGLSLADLGSLEPASNRDRGSFVPADSRCESLVKAWASELKRLKAEDLVDTSLAQDLTAAMVAFETTYTQAISDMTILGAGATSLALQAIAYSELLERIVDGVRAPLALHALLKPLLSVGTAPIEATSAAEPAVIVCPWHPLRLSAQHARLISLRQAFAGLMAAGPLGFTDDGSLFFDELSRALASPGRPDVIASWTTGTQPELLTQTDALHDYSLHEPPVTATGRAAATNENAIPTARHVAELARNYLALQPHEKDNLSIVLYNCDAAALPQAVVDSIRIDAEREDGDAMCQVILRHTNEDQLRELYQQLVARELADDGLHASEASRDFMARLRIAILVNQLPTSVGGAPPLDIVFCHDVISRHAKLDWVDIDRITRPAESIDPNQWSRRQPIGPGHADAVVYLTCPAHPAEGWTYLDAIAALNDPQLAASARAAGKCRVPVRRTDILSPETKQILDDTHRLGSWVVNVDDLLDRRQLRNNGINVIRYKHLAAGNRSLIISSRAPDSLLRATLRGRLRALNPGFPDEALDALSQRLIADANSVSGDIVLRAAKRGKSASELIGVVLSKFLIEAELGRGRQLAWIFLDDYANWLGQGEKRIADLLCLAPTLDENGAPCLDIIVTEAKYVSAGNLAKSARDSAQQLRDTLSRLETALLPEGHAPADQGIWLARLSEMLLDGLRDRSGAPNDPTVWRTMVRDGTCRVRLRGYSHVFVHGPAEAEPGLADSFTGVPLTRTGYQEQYAPPRLRRILRAYADNSDPMPLRRDIAGREIFSHVSSTGLSEPRSPSTVTDDDDRVASPSIVPDANEDVKTGRDPSKGAPEGIVGGMSAFRAALLASTVDVAGDEIDAAWLDEVASRCRTALLRYGMSAKLEQQSLTPNAALLKFKGSDDLTVSKVEAKLTELETTHGLEVLSVRAEPSRISLSIRRPNRQLLTLPQVWRGWGDRGAIANTRLLIAIKEDDGSPLFLEPEPAPHTLVAGSTGSGKSVLIQNILLGIAATNRPDQAQIVLIDPKAGVDYFSFENLPHLDGGIIDEPNAALSRLDALVDEMERRYALFKVARVPNVRAYNRSAELALPVIWLVHDEFADWMQIDSYRAGVEAAVSRLGVKARAAGIYLIFAAQRPDNSVFPMQLRSNLGNRLVLRVDSAGTSDLSLGVKGGGAERLLGKGHLAALLGGGTQPIYAQVPYIGEDELEIFVTALMRDEALVAAR